MGNKTLINGLIVFGAGMLASCVSSFLEHVAVLGAATNFTRGFFDGLSVVVFCVAIFLLVRSRRTT